MNGDKPVCVQINQCVNQLDEMSLTCVRVCARVCARVPVCVCVCVCV